MDENPFRNGTVYLLNINIQLDSLMEWLLL